MKPCKYCGKDSPNGVCEPCITLALKQSIEAAQQWKRDKLALALEFKAKAQAARVQRRFW